MKSFKELFCEVGESAKPVVWSKDEVEWRGYFFVDDQKFDIDITILDSCEHYDIIQFKFYRDKETKLFNDNKFSFPVYATVKTALEEYVSEMHPDALLFASVDDVKARKALYKLEGGRLATKYDYHDISKIPEMDGVPLFGIYKTDELKQCVYDLIGL